MHHLTSSKLLYVSVLRRRKKAFTTPITPVYVVVHMLADDVLLYARLNRVPGLTVGAPVRPLPLWVRMCLMRIDLRTNRAEQEEQP